MVTEKEIYNKVGEENYFNSTTRKILRVRNKVISRFLYGDILDVGCGYGFLFEDLPYYLKSKYYGIDISQERINYCIRKYKKPFHFRVCDVYKLDKPKRHFDTIVMQEVLEHLFYPDKALKQVFSKFENSGRLIITVPYKEKIRYEVCVHCGKRTPRNGHLWVCDETGITHHNNEFSISWNVLFEGRPFNKYYLVDFTRIFKFFRMLKYIPETVLYEFMFRNLHNKKYASHIMFVVWV